MRGEGSLAAFLQKKPLVLPPVAESLDPERPRDTLACTLRARGEFPAGADS